MNDLSYMELCTCGHIRDEHHEGSCDMCPGGSGVHVFEATGKYGDMHAGLGHLVDGEWVHDEVWEIFRNFRFRLLFPNSPYSGGDEAAIKVPSRGKETRCDLCGNPTPTIVAVSHWKVCSRCADVIHDRTRNIASGPPLLRVGERAIWSDGTSSTEWP